MDDLNKASKPRVVLVSETPSLVKSITPNISKFAEVNQSEVLINRNYHICHSDTSNSMSSLEYAYHRSGYNLTNYFLFTYF